MQRASLTLTVQRLSGSTYSAFVGESLGKNSLLAYGSDPRVLAFFEEALRTTANAVYAITKVVDIDSSGFPTLAQANYRNDGKGRQTIRPYAQYFRGHVASCAATNIIGAFIPTFSYGEDSSDFSQFEELLTRAKKIWNINVVTADKIYYGDEHLYACDQLGVRFICPPKVDSRPENSKYPFLAARLHDLYYHHRDEFDSWYSWRAKIESVFSTIEQLYGKDIWARGAYNKQKNDLTVPLSIHIELLAKCIAQNVSQLVYLEEILEQRVNFVEHRYLHPIDASRVVSGRTLLAA